MPRFRRLTLDELSVLEKEFIQFLAAQSITADDWVKIQADNPQRVESLVNDFSDVVYGSIIQRAEFLELRTAKSVSCYQLLANKAVMVLLELEDGEDVDLRESSSLERLASGTLTPTTRVMTTDKMWSTNREDEIFTMMLNGCVITDGALFKLLCTFL